MSWPRSSELLSEAGRYTLSSDSERTCEPSSSTPSLSGNDFPGPVGSRCYRYAAEERLVAITGSSPPTPSADQGQRTAPHVNTSPDAMPFRSSVHSHRSRESRKFFRGLHHPVRSGAFALSTSDLLTLRPTFSVFEMRLRQIQKGSYPDALPEHP